MTDYSNYTALIVDDEEPILRLAEASLKRRGFKVIAALTGEEALELSDDLDNSIDIVVMDVVMPDVNGPELAERILERHPQARLIFASGYGTGAEAALKRRHKNALYLRKPFGIQQLYNRIEEALGQE